MALLAAKFWSFYVQGSLFLSVFFVRQNEAEIYFQTSQNACENTFMVDLLCGR